MRADREDFVARRERRNSSYTIVAAIAGVLVLALVLYYGLSGASDLAGPTTTATPVVRDSAFVAPPVVDTTSQSTSNAIAPATTQQSAAVAGEFPERRLAPANPTVGAGEAPELERDGDAEGLVIDGPLLEELEADARERAR